MDEPEKIRNISYNWLGPDESRNIWGGWGDPTLSWEGVDIPAGGMFTVKAIEIPKDMKLEVPSSFPKSAGGDFDGDSISTKYAIHAKGTGYTGDGGHWGPYSKPGQPGHYEDYIGGGVTFFARMGDDPYANTNITVAYENSNFQPLPQTNGPIPGMSDETPPAGPPPANHCAGTGSAKCHDVPQITVPLRNYWEQYIIPFAMFAQQGYGYHVNNPEQTLTEFSYIWIVLPKAVRFDFWITGFGLFTAEQYAALQK